MTDFIDNDEYLKEESDSDTATSDSETEEEIDQVTEETEPLTEEQIREIQRREYITKVKVIAFDSLGKDPLTNGSTLFPTEKARVISKMEEIMTLDESEISKIFNSICTEKIFSIDKDYTVYSVYDN